MRKITDSINIKKDSVVWAISYMTFTYFLWLVYKMIPLGTITLNSHVGYLMFFTYFSLIAILVVIIWVIFMGIFILLFKLLFSKEERMKMRWLKIRYNMTKEEFELISKKFKRKFDGLTPDKKPVLEGGYEFAKRILTEALKEKLKR